MKRIGLLVITLALGMASFSATVWAKNPLSEGIKTVGSSQGISGGDTMRILGIRFPSGRILQAEVAETPEQQLRGLMYRRELPKNRGMLFIYEQDGFYGIWMKNCLIALDILWLDANRRVVHREENAPPCRTEKCPIYTPAQSARYVLEISAGLLTKEGIQLGSLIDIWTEP